MSHTKYQVFMSIRSLMMSFCKIVRVGGDGWIQGGSFVSHTKFQVFMSIRSLIRSLCKIVRGEGGQGEMVGFWVVIWCHIPNFRSLCQSVLSLLFFTKMRG